MKEDQFNKEVKSLVMQLVPILNKYDNVVAAISMCELLSFHIVQTQEDEEIISVIREMVLEKRNRGIKLHEGD